MAVQTLMGIDSCKAGWIVAAGDLQLSTIRLGIEERLDRLIGFAECLALLGRFLPILELQEGVRPRFCDPVTGKGPLSPKMDVDAIRQALGTPRVSPDDLVDALAALVSAYRLWAGEATVLPAGPPAEDQRGLRMEIVASSSLGSWRRGWDSNPR